MTWVIRPSTSGDIAAVDALLARSYPVLLKADYAPSLLVTAIPRIARANPALLTCGTYYVVEDGDDLLAAGGWTRGAPPNLDGTDATTAHVRHVVTDHRRTREGVGRALMGHVMRAAAAAGVRQLECQSTLTAEPFYAACGFHRVGPVQVPLMPGLDFPAIRMHRDLHDLSGG